MKHLNDWPAISFLGELAVRVANSYRGSDAYPVLGAEGNDFFVEISSGGNTANLLGRNIHTTIYINFATDNCPASDIQENLDELSIKTEMAIKLPDASYLVALLGMLGVAMGNSTKILHPLDQNGNYLENWSETLTAVSEKPS